MFKRTLWFSVGAVAGVAGLRRVERAVAERRAQMAPEALVYTASDAASRASSRVRDALRDGRDEMSRVASELEAHHDPSNRSRRSSLRAVEN